MSSSTEHFQPQAQTTSSPPALGTNISRFEQIVANNPPVLSSLIAQLPTASILSLYHTSPYLKSLFRQTPTSWRYISWRLHQPAPNQVVTATHTNGLALRQSSNYALDQLLMYVIIPFSTRLTSLVLDNTAVSGATLFQTVVYSRKETLEHVSVRGCKNVSLKYHINPWLIMHAMALEQPNDVCPPEFQKLALKSLYTYRCRHHRRRPYLPSSLIRKESDSEPTHELVLTCHKLGIWTDTAWCTTPGARCYRRRGYVTMRVQQDPREVWVVYDRLWRSRNWLGPAPSASKQKKRKRDGRVWEEEPAVNGEPVGLGEQGKDVPVHLRHSHRQFVENIHCDNCSAQILERCEQCTVLMHCSGCRKTLCASCAFDRPYLRNQNASEEAKKKFWWAPGCAVSPCSMQDLDPVAAGAPNLPNTLPNIKFKWCCTEPVFSGGGGITLGATTVGDFIDKLRAAPLPPGHGFEDQEFSPTHDHESHHELLGSPLTKTNVTGPGGRWASLAEMFRYGAQINPNEESDSVPRILCDTCHSSEQWKIKCRACSVALCLKHDVKEKQRVRICGYKELGLEKQELIKRLKATRQFKTMWLKHKEEQRNDTDNTMSEAHRIMEEAQLALAADVLLEEGSSKINDLEHLSPNLFPFDRLAATALPIRTGEPSAALETEPIGRPLSPGSNSTGPLSRASSPAPSARSVSATPEPHKAEVIAGLHVVPSNWKGCQAFFCAAIRQSGDHRRRCSAIIRQCHECKVYVCDDCTAGLEKSCPCKGCRLENGETDPVSGGTAAFFCPNCRHSRIISRKCRRHLACLSRSSTPTPQKERKHRLRQRMTPQDKIGHIADILLDTHLSGFGEPEFTLETFYGSVDQELQELQEISLSAVNVVRRVQTLRSQAAPGSPAALALPNIIIEGVDTPLSANLNGAPP